MDHHHHQSFHQIPTPPPFDDGLDGHDIMTRSPPVFPMEGFINNTHNNNNYNRLPTAPAAARIPGDTGLFEGYYDQPQQELRATFIGPTHVAIDDGFSFHFKHDHQQDIMNEYGGLGGSPPWHQQNLASSQSCISAAVDSPSSMCGSPTSILTPKTGDNQGSGSSEDEDTEVKAGPDDQSNNPDDKKLLRRKESNRKSAHRSRKRKQDQLHQLETQVESLSGENVDLFKQLGYAAQQLREATTNNRVLKSDVEALRAKVKLAEDRVTRGTIMSPALNHILQTQMVNAQALSRVLSPLSTTMGFQGQDNSAFGGAFSGIMAHNNNKVMSDQILNGNAGSPGLVGSATDASCVSEMWPYV